MLMVCVQDVVHKSGLPSAKKACSNKPSSRQNFKSTPLCLCCALLQALLPVIKVTGTDLKVSGGALWPAGTTVGFVACTESAQLANQLV